ncbi:hypothetical protein COCNU_scaffold001767G000040 [Cocos nucifera]|nr:hypothetical protein [Cocos nucifera]
MLGILDIVLRLGAHLAKQASPVEPSLCAVPLEIPGALLGIRRPSRIHKNPGSYASSWLEKSKRIFPSKSHLPRRHSSKQWDCCQAGMATDDAFLVADLFFLR